MPPWDGDVIGQGPSPLPAVALLCRCKAALRGAAAAGQARQHPWSARQVAAVLVAAVLVAAVLVAAGVLAGRLPEPARVAAHPVRQHDGVLVLAGNAISRESRLSLLAEQSDCTGVSGVYPASGGTVVSLAQAFINGVPADPAASRGPGRLVAGAQPFCEVSLTQARPPSGWAHAEVWLPLFGWNGRVRNVTGQQRPGAPWGALASATNSGYAALSAGVGAGWAAAVANAVIRAYYGIGVEAIAGI
jgi:hypothetical protein